MKYIQEKQVWNQYVLAHAPGALFQSWEWGEVEKKQGKKVWRMEWKDGIAQVVKIEARRGRFLHIRHGPIGTIAMQDVIDLARQEHAWFIRISPQQNDVSDYLSSGFVSAPIHAMDAETCWVLDLEPSEETLLAGMRKSTRYEIKHSEVTVQEMDSLSAFFDLYNQTAKRQNFVEHRGIQEEFDALSCECLVASHNGAPLAAAIIVYFGDQAIYHHGASIPNKVGASYALQWEAIRRAKAKGKHLYNFWGIAPPDKPDHPWHGLTVFKMGFGGRQVSYAHAMDYPISPLYRIPRTIEYIRRKLKGY